MWGKAEGEYGPPLPIIYNACQKTNMSYAGYRILHGTAVPLLLISGTGNEKSMTLIYLSTNVEKHSEFVMSLFSGKEAQNVEKYHALENLS